MGRQAVIKLNKTSEKSLQSFFKKIEDYVLCDFESFKNKFNGDYKNVYILEVSLIELLYSNETLKELFDETFELSDDTPRVITYIDEITKQRGMFSLLSNGLDRLSDSTSKGDIAGSIRIINSLKPSVTRIVNTANKQYTNKAN